MKLLPLPFAIRIALAGVRVPYQRVLVSNDGLARVLQYVYLQVRSNEN